MQPAHSARRGAAVTASGLSASDDDDDWMRDVLASPVVSSDGGADAKPAVTDFALGDAGDPYEGLSPRSRRKRKNRDQMRAARLRERETMDRLRVTVERLEARYQSMQKRDASIKAEPEHEPATMAANASAGATPLAAASTPAPASTAAREPASASATTSTAAYSGLISLSSSLKEENFHLKQTLHEKHKLRETLERRAVDLVEPSPEEQRILKQEFPDDSAPPDAASTQQQHQQQHAVESDAAMSASGITPAYTPMTQEQVWALIAETQKRLAQVHAIIRDQELGPRDSITVLQGDDVLAAEVTAATTPTASPVPPGEDDHSCSSSSSPSSPPFSSSSSGLPVPPPAPPLPSFCGWALRHQAHGDCLLFEFDKSFPHVSAYPAMVRMWTNERGMRSYRDARDSENQTLEIVQQLNDDTYVFRRRLVNSATRRAVVNTYLRFRLTTAQGFLIGMASIDPDEPGSAGPSSSVWASRACVWTEFLPIVGNAGCRVRMVGSTNFETPKTAHRNIADVIIGLLRWENRNIGPAFTLTQS